MKVKIIGIEPQKYTLNGEQITGQKLHYTYEHKNIDGNGAGYVFERNGIRKLGEEVQLCWSYSFKKFYIKK